MEEVITRCPDCGTETDHQILKSRESTITAQCLDCERVHSFSPPRVTTIEVGLVISEGSQSRHARMPVIRDEEIAIGHEFDFEGHRMLVTGLEHMDGRHVSPLLGEQVRTVFAKVFDTVTLRFSVNEHEITKSYQQEVLPETEVHIGQVFAVDGRKLKVKTLKSDENRTLHRGFLLARNVRRCFCDEVPHWVKEGKILQTRKRGKPPGAKSVPRLGPKR